MLWEVERMGVVSSEMKIRGWTRRGREMGW